MANPQASCIAPPAVPPTVPLIIGAGYLGGRVVNRFLHAGVRPVWATSRHPPTIVEGDQTGVIENRRTSGPAVRWLSLDITDRRTFDSLAEFPFPSAASVLVAVSHDRRTDKPASATHVDGLANLVDWLEGARPEGAGHRPAITLISTTGVYHQDGGRWVDETSPTRPTRASAIAHRDGEILLRRRWADRGGRATVLRLAGIYGPRRLPKIDEVRQGTVRIADPDSYLNLIHIDDAVEAAFRAMTRRPSSDGGVDLFCVADDAPMRRGDFYTAVAKRLGVDAPAFEAPTADAGRRIGGGNRRVRNRKLRRELLPSMTHPRSVGRCGLPGGIDGLVRRLR